MIVADMTGGDVLVRLFVSHSRKIFETDLGKVIFSTLKVKYCLHSVTRNASIYSCGSREVIIVLRCKRLHIFQN